jgi:hypothetical protein
MFLADKAHDLYFFHFNEGSKLEEFADIESLDIRDHRTESSSADAKILCNDGLGNSRKNMAKGSQVPVVDQMLDRRISFVFGTVIPEHSAKKRSSFVILQEKRQNVIQKGT